MVQPQAKHCRISQICTNRNGNVWIPIVFLEQSHTHHSGVKIKTCNSLWKAPTQDSTQGCHQGHDCCCLKAPVDWTSRWKEDGTSHSSIIQRVKSTKQTTDSWSQLQKNGPAFESSKGLTATMNFPCFTATGLLPIHFLTHPGSPDLRETVDASEIRATNHGTLGIAGLGPKLWDWIESNPPAARMQSWLKVSVVIIPDPKNGSCHPAGDDFSSGGGDGMGVLSKR